MDGGAAAFAGGAASEGMNDEDNERYNQRLTELKNMNISELEVAIASELKKPSKQKVLSLIEEQNTKALCWQFFSHVHERKKGFLLNHVTLIKQRSDLFPVVHAMQCTCTPVRMKHQR